MRACALTLMAGLLMPMPAASAGDCPAPGDLDGMEAAIRRAPTCRSAAAIARACAYGATGDTALSTAVIAVCETDFLSGLDARGRKVYVRQRAACDRRYEHRAGSMYRSAAAFCEAAVSERYSQAVLARRGPR